MGPALIEYSTRVETWKLTKAGSAFVSFVFSCQERISLTSRDLGSIGACVRNFLKSPRHNQLKVSDSGFFFVSPINLCVSSPQ